MTTDTLETWEKWPVGALVASAGLNTALWYASPVLPPQAWQLVPWLTMLAGLAAVVAIDGSLIATIAGMRQGRRSRWSVANIFITALFTALAAWAAHGVFSEISPWLHGLFALTIVAYLMHLAQPRADVGIALALRAQELDAREMEIDERLHDVTEQKFLIDSRMALADKVVLLRDQEKMSFADIGVLCNISRQSAWQQYKSAKGN